MKLDALMVEDTNDSERCTECGSDNIQKNVCRNCGLVIGRELVHTEYHYKDIIKGRVCHEIYDRWGRGTVISSRDIQHRLSDPLQRRKYARLQYVQRYTCLMDNANYENLLLRHMMDYCKTFNVSRTVQKEVAYVWKQTLKKMIDGKLKFQWNYVACACLYATLKRYIPFLSVSDVMKNYNGLSGTDFSITKVLYIIRKLSIPFVFYSLEDYVENAIMWISPMFYNTEDEIFDFSLRLRHNFKLLHNLINVGSEAPTNLVGAILYGACQIESINKGILLPATVTTPRIAERLGLLPYTVRLIYNNKIKNVIEKYAKRKNNEI